LERRYIDGGCSIIPHVTLNQIWGNLAIWFSAHVGLLHGDIQHSISMRGPCFFPLCIVTVLGAVVVLFPVSDSSDTLRPMGMSDASTCAGDRIKIFRRHVAVND
jgi:hypothetical protein